MDALLSTENLTKEFLPRAVGGLGKTVRAIDSVNLTIRPGARIAIVGGSGSGKSTLAACLALLERPTSGKISFQGRDVTNLSEKELRAIRPITQLVFQDSAAAFNPDFSVLQILEEPLLINSALGPQEKRAKAGRLLERVGLQEKMLSRRTNELSGGQRQRVAIARALVLEPKALILDEALSAQDSSIQAQVANLLLDLSDPAIPLEKRPAIILITHDLVMAARIADEIMVMQNGRIVESGPSRKLLTFPTQEATKAIVAATAGSSFIVRPEHAG